MGFLNYKLLLKSLSFIVYLVSFILFFSIANIYFLIFFIIGILIFIMNIFVELKKMSEDPKVKVAIEGAIINNDIKKYKKLKNYTFLSINDYKYFVELSLKQDCNLYFIKDGISKINNLVFLKEIINDNYHKIKNIEKRKAIYLLFKEKGIQFESFSKKIQFDNMFDFI